MILSLELDSAGRDCIAAHHGSIPTHDKMRASRYISARPRSGISIDLVGCDADLIGDFEQIRRFTAALCDLLAMPYGEPIVARLGAVCSLLQMHEGAIVSGHFDEASGDAFIDIFSYQPCEPAHVAEFCRSWFGAASMRINVVLRLVEGYNGV